MNPIKIKNGTVVRFKISGKHDFSYAIIVPSDRWGGSRLKDFDPDKKIVRFMGYDERFIFQSEIIDHLKLKNLLFIINFSDEKTGLTHSYEEYLKLVYAYSKKIEESLSNPTE